MNNSRNKDHMSHNKKGLPKTYKTLEQALCLAKEAVQGEREDELFYDYLISVAPSQEEVKIIESIRDDERKHNKMFKAIYKYYTCEDIETSMDVNFEKPRSYIDGIKKALFGELSAMERYRIIRAGLPDRYFRDMVFEILTDEMKHATKYNYILNLNLERMVMGEYNDNMCMPMHKHMNMGLMGMPMDMDMNMNMGYMDMPMNMDMNMEKMCMPMNQHMNMGNMCMPMHQHMNMGNMCMPMHQHMNMGNMCMPMDKHMNMGIMDMDMDEDMDGRFM